MLWRYRSSADTDSRDTSAAFESILIGYRLSSATSHHPREENGEHERSGFGLDVLFVFFIVAILASTSYESEPARGADVRPLDGRLEEVNYFFWLSSLLTP
jgi:hypothetical protein